MSRQIQLRYKGNKCASCGLSIEEMISRYGTFKRMTEFHHIDPTSKSKKYDSLIQRKLSTETLEELDKCILLCRQCHGVLHAQNINGHIQLYHEIYGKTYSQKFKGQCIFDALERKLRFFSEDRFLLIPYQVKIGSDTPKLVMGVEMDTGEYFSTLLKGLREYKMFEIRDSTGTKVMMRGIYKGSNEVELKQSLEFPFLKYEMTSDENSLWVRNGRMITSGGKFVSKGILTSTMELVDND